MLLDKLYNIKIAVKYVVSSLRKNLFYIWVSYLYESRF